MTKQAGGIQITTGTGEYTLYETAYINGSDPLAVPPLTLRTVNLWDDVPRSRIMGRIAHAEEVVLLGAQHYGVEDRWYFLVRGKAGRERGWLPESLLSPEPRSVVGDVL